MGKALLLAYVFVSTLASATFALSPQEIKNKNASDLTHLEAELRAQSQAVSEAEQAWTRKIPDLVKTFCPEGALRDSLRHFGAKCRSCNEVPGFAPLLQSSESCRALSRSEWTELLGAPRSRGALRFASETLEAEDLARIDELINSRFPVNAAKAKHEQARRRIDQLKRLQEIVSCQGEPVAEINLDDQFPPTLDQGDLGTCYAYAATAVAEAAIYRNEGRRVSLSPLYAAACSRLPGGVSSDEPSLAGGNTEEVLRHWLRRGRSLKCSGESCTAEELETTLKAGEYIENMVIPGAGRVGGLGSRLQVNAASFAVTKMERDSPNAVVELSGDSYQLNDLSGKVFHRASRCDPLDAENSAHLKAITESLCRGIPVATANYMKDFEKSSDGGKTWERHSEVNEAYDPNIWHAMVITGIEWADGKPHYVFRNSWGAGDEKTPHASKMRLPVSAGCRIYNASTLSGTREGAAAAKRSRVREPMPSSANPHSLRSVAP